MSDNEKESEKVPLLEIDTTQSSTIQNNHGDESNGHGYNAAFHRRREKLESPHNQNNNFIPLASTSTNVSSTSSATPSSSSNNNITNSLERLTLVSTALASLTHNSKRDRLYFNLYRPQWRIIAVIIGTLLIFSILYYLLTHSYSLLLFPKQVLFNHIPFFLKSSTIHHNRDKHHYNVKHHPPLPEINQRPESSLKPPTSPRSREIEEATESEVSIHSPPPPYFLPTYDATDSLQVGTNNIESWEFCSLHREHPLFPKLDPLKLDDHHSTTGFAGGNPHVNITFTPSMLGNSLAGLMTDTYNHNTLMTLTVLNVKYDKSLGDFLLICVLDFAEEGVHTTQPEHKKGQGQWYDVNHHYRHEVGRDADTVRMAMWDRFVNWQNSNTVYCMDSVSGLLIPATSWLIENSYFQFSCHYPLYPRTPTANLSITLLHSEKSMFNVPQEPSPFPSLIDNTPFSIPTNTPTPKIHSRFIPYTYPPTNLSPESVSRLKISTFAYQLAAPILLPLLLPTTNLSSSMVKAVSDSIGGHLHISVCRKVLPPVTFALCSPPLFTNHFIHNMRHFINHHAYMGIERFYIYDRFGHYRSTLEPYIESGLVIYKRFAFWYHPSMPLRYVYYDQLTALEECRYIAGTTTQWLVNIDFDEWLSFPIEASLTPVFPSSCIQYKKDHMNSVIAYAKSSKLIESRMTTKDIDSYNITKKWSAHTCHSPLHYFIALGMRDQMLNTYIAFHAIRILPVNFIIESDEYIKYIDTVTNHPDEWKSSSHPSLQSISHPQSYPLPLKYDKAPTYSKDAKNWDRSKYIYRPYQPVHGRCEIHYLDYIRQLTLDGWIVQHADHFRFNHYINWIVVRGDPNAKEDVLYDGIPIKIYWDIQDMAQENYNKSQSSGVREMRKKIQ